MSREGALFDDWSLTLGVSTRVTRDRAFVRSPSCLLTSTPTRESHGDVISNLSHLTPRAEICPEDAGVTDVPFPQVRQRRLGDTTIVRCGRTCDRDEHRRGDSRRTD
jgi:hypothetical protein